MVLVVVDLGTALVDLVHTQTPSNIAGATPYGNAGGAGTDGNGDQWYLVVAGGAGGAGGGPLVEMAALVGNIF